MKRIVGILTLAIVLAAGAALAQQQTPAQPSPEQGHGHIDGGLCPMMGGGIDERRHDGDDAREVRLARMMQTRGEMLKAMGDVMMKCGKLMEGGSQ